MAGSTSDAAAGPADRFDPARPFLGASVAVFRDGRVMLAARGRAPMEGLYSLPGGGVEPGETGLDALARELREEAAIEITGEARLHGVYLNLSASDRDVSRTVR